MTLDLFLTFLAVLFTAIAAIKTVAWLSGSRRSGGRNDRSATTTDSSTSDSGFYVGTTSGSHSKHESDGTDGDSGSGGDGGGGD